MSNPLSASDILTVADGSFAAFVLLITDIEGRFASIPSIVSVDFDETFPALSLTYILYEPAE